MATVMKEGMARGQKDVSKGGRDLRIRFVS